MAKKIKSYIDTSAFISFLDRSDSYHSVFARLFANPPRLVTSPLVIAEGHAWFLRRYDGSRAIEFLNFIDELSGKKGPLTVVPIGEAELLRAGEYIRQFSDQDLTIADALGLVIMKDYKLKECWSTDRHLAVTGSRLIIYELE